MTAAGPSPRRRILVVEDESGIADTICYALATDGFEPHVCSLGGDALRELETGEYALIILDVGLPDMNGFDLFRQLRARGAIPVIFVTARAEEVDRIVGLELGADDYVAKPFSPRELVARVRTVLRRTAAGIAGGASDARVETPASSAFRVDEERRRISFCGQVLDLTRYEYGVLKTLIARPGRVFSRDEL